MTAVVVLERALLDDVYTAAPYAALPVESKIDLQPGERMQVSDLLRALLLASANDAAVTLAVGSSGSRGAFVAQMNRAARQLRLRDTRFANPIGLDAPDNYSTAADLARLTVRARRSPFLRRTIDLERARLRTGDRPRTILNRNRLVRRVPVVDGVKTGRTLRAGYVLIGSATRGGITVVSVVLGEPSEAARDADTLALLRYGLARFRRAVVLGAGRAIARVPVRHRERETVALVATRGVRRVVRRDERLSVRAQGVPRVLEGPLPRGARVGTAIVSLRGRVLARIPLRTARAVPEVGLVERVRAGLPTLALVLGAGGLLVLASLLIVARQRAARRRREARRRADRRRRPRTEHEETPVG